jgi:mono/diheme cytochrome c family protein
MKWRIVLFLLVLIAVVAFFAAAAFVRPRLTGVERGRRIAEANGCFACHGPEGTKGVPNVGRVDLTVPSFSGALMMYAKDAGQVREWIENGGTQAKRASATWNAEREKGTLRMPRFKDRLTKHEIDDLVAFVLASAGEPAPEDSLPSAGLERAQALGCFGCHGTGGRFARPNPGSFKGYVPPWDGPDFPDLVASREEFNEWVESGVSRRFAANPVASYFLRRAPLHMPHYKTHLDPGDLDALWAYVTWLRVRPAATP